MDEVESCREGAPGEGGGEHKEGEAAQVKREGEEGEEGEEGDVDEGNRGEGALDVAQLESLGLDELLGLKSAFTDEEGKQTRHISMAILGRAFRRVWPNLAADEVEELLRKIDVDNSGEISWEELLSFMVLHNQLIQQIRDASFVASLNTFARPTSDESPSNDKPHQNPVRFAASNERSRP